MCIPEIILFSAFLIFDEYLAKNFGLSKRAFMTEPKIEPNSQEILNFLGTVDFFIILSQLVVFYKDHIDLNVSANSDEVLIPIPWVPALHESGDKVL